MANSIAPNEAGLYEPHHLHLCFLQKKCFVWAISNLGFKHQMANSIDPNEVALSLNEPSHYHI